MAASITLYRFLAAEWALESLRKRRLRISRIAELNDPFEWRVGTIAETLQQAEAGRLTFDAFLERINNQWGIVSMSAEATDPVIWSHYADSHKGIALEFDHYRDSGLYAIAYSHALPTFDVTKFISAGLGEDYIQGVLRAALCRKSITWGYEREYRSHLDLIKCDKEDGHYFSQISDNFLKRVILGIRCEVTKADVEAALAQGGFTDIEVVQARMSETAYEILCD